MENVEEVLNFARVENKPTMIAESTPFGGINMKTPNTVKYNDTDPWDRWYAKVIDLIERYDIDMWSYINCNWESESMWKGVGFGDTRLSSSNIVMNKWQEVVVDGKGQQTFLMKGSLKTCSLESIPSSTYWSDAPFGLPVVMLLVILICLVKMRNATTVEDKRNLSESTVLVSNRS